LSKPRTILSGASDCESFTSILSQTEASPLAKRLLQNVSGRRVSGHAHSIEHACEEARLVGRAEGYEEGLREGRDRGIKLGLQKSFGEAMKLREAELVLFREALAEILRRIDAAMEAWYESSERQLAPLAMEIASRILTEEMKLSRDSALSIAKAALAEVTHAMEARIRVNPSDLEALQEHMADLVSCAQSLRQIEITDDPTIRGGCIIDTDGGMIDASFDGQLDSLRERLDEEAA
jgi:flagellar assembly protein FliH